MDDLFGSLPTNLEFHGGHLLHLDCPRKFSSFGRFFTDSILNKKYDKNFLIDFDSRISKRYNCKVNIKEGFSINKPLAENGGVSAKTHRKYSVLVENNEFFMFEGKVANFSTKKLKFNFFSKFSSNNLRIYSFFKPYYSQNYSFSKIGFIYCGQKVHLNNRLELDNDVSFATKTMVFPNNFSFLGGLLKYNFHYNNLEMLSLILGLKKENYEFIFKNTTFYRRNLKKVSLNVGQIFDENLSLAAKYKYIIENQVNEKNKFKFGVVYFLNKQIKNTMNWEVGERFKIGTHLKVNEFVKIILNYDFCLNKNEKKIGSPIGCCIKINLI